MTILESILFSGLIILFASIVRGTTGFGLALVALPLLTIIFPVKEAVILLAVVNFLFSVIHIIRERALLKIRIIIITGVFSMAGVFFGFVVLRTVPDNWLSIFAGATIIISGIAMLRGFSIKISNISVACSIASFFGGVLAGSITIGGPFAALVLTGTNISKERFRSAMSYFFLFSYGFAVILYALDNLINREVLLNVGATLPFLFTGLIIGERVSKTVDQKSFRLFILIMLLLMGFLMIYRNIV